MVNNYGIRLGSCVSLNYSGTRVAIGAYYDYTNTTQAGSVQCWNIVIQHGINLEILFLWRRYIRTGW